MKFIGNHATKNGGSVWSWSNAIEANNTSITASLADNYGGGVYLESASLKLRNSSIDYNSADGSGSQLYCKSASVQIDRRSSIDPAVSAECHQCSITFMDGGGALQCSPAGSRAGGVSALVAALHQLAAAVL
jgi:hypothetical protein